jgi:histidine triad (HIT) family protein
MTNCDYCKLIEEKSMTVFEDETVAAVLAPQGASKGHTLIVPKQHTTILEQVPDSVVARIFVLANKVSTVLLQALRAHGTNMIVENGTAAGQGTPHFAVNVIPRTENDGLGFSWHPKKFTEEQISMAELQLKEESKTKAEEKKTPLKIEEKKRVIKDENDYLVRQLKRIP